MSSSSKIYCSHAQIILGDCDFFHLFLTGQERRQDATADMRRVSDGKKLPDAFHYGYLFSVKLVKFLCLLLPNQPLFSFIHPVTLLLLIFGSGAPEEDEQIRSFVLTEGGKTTPSSFSPVGQSLLCITVHGDFCAYCLCFRTSTETLTPIARTVTTEEG